MLRRRVGAGLAQSLTADGALSCASTERQHRAPAPRRAQVKLFERNRRAAEDSDAELRPGLQLSGVFPPPRPVSIGETWGISPVLSATLRAAA